MDPLKTVFNCMPEEGIELRDRVRKHKESSDETEHQEQPRTKRLCVRSGTLPPLTDQKPDLSEPLKAEQDLANYTRERLEQGLLYIVAAASQPRLTPRTLCFLGMHKYAYTEALKGHHPQPKETAVAVVQEFDRVYNTQAFFLRPASDEKRHQINNEILALRRLELLANWGGCLDKDELEGYHHAQEQLKQATEQGDKDVKLAQQQDLNPVQTSSKQDLDPDQIQTWSTKLADQLTSHKDQILPHINTFAGVLGIEAGHVRQLIEETCRGGEQENRKFHNQTREYIKRTPQLRQPQTTNPSRPDRGFQHTYGGVAVPSKSGNFIRESHSLDTG